jgi:hypothetical protein
MEKKKRSKKRKSKESANAGISFDRFWEASITEPLLLPMEA